MAVEPDSIRPGGYISGPTQFALADGVLWYLVFGATERIEPMAVTSELSIRFVRPALGNVLWARATLDSISRHKMVGSVRVWVDDRPDRPSSIAQGTYALPRQAPK
jgi:acyl-coenzyme A thioesterase PaaI-like protein